ncbi:Tuberous sclerosis 2-like protein [Coemansia sp. BCRC 34301]|nr:Tuberous sclerosis 2-like protein [Coemansia sp. BCRC 34301]
MSKGERPAPKDRGKGGSAIANLLRNMAGTFSNDDSTASPSRGLVRADTGSTSDGTGDTPYAQLSANLHTSGQQALSPPPQQQQQHQSTTTHLQDTSPGDCSLVRSDDASADGEPADALTIYQRHAAMSDKDAPLDARLAALEALVFELRGRPVDNISSLWCALSGVVSTAFGAADEGEQSVAMGQTQRESMRLAVFSGIAVLADLKPDEPRFGEGGSAQTRAEMLQILALANGCLEVSLALQCVVWLSNNAQSLPGSLSGWLERAHDWVVLVARCCYPDDSHAAPSYIPPEGMPAALTAAIEFLSRIISTEYPRLDPKVVSDISYEMFERVAQTRPIDDNGANEVAWVWNHTDHIYGVLHLLKTVIKYGALVRRELRCGVLLLCTSVNIMRCKELCCEIVYTLFTSCYMRDTLLIMNHILSKGNVALNARQIHGVPTLTPYEAAVNGIVFYITQVMDTGPTGIQFSLRMGSCLPVLDKAVQCMHPRVLRLVFPYMCKIVNDDRAELMLSEDWSAIMSILLTTVDCRLVEGYDDALDNDLDTEAPAQSIAELYDCALSSVVDFFSRGTSPAPAVLAQLLFGLRETMSDSVACSALRFIKISGGLSPGAADCASQLEEFMHLYYFDRSRSIELRRCMVQLCAEVFAKAAEVAVVDFGTLPIITSTLEQLHLEEDEALIDSVLDIVSTLLKRTKSSIMFRSTLEYAVRAAIEPEYSCADRKASASQPSPQPGSGAGDVSPTYTSAQPQAVPTSSPSAPTSEDAQLRGELTFASHRRVTSTVCCLLGVLGWRITTTVIYSDERYGQHSADSVKLANTLLDLLESRHTFHSARRSILSFFLRLHSDSSFKLYVLRPDQDTIIDQRVSPHENARLKLARSEDCDNNGRADADGGSGRSDAWAEEALFPIKRYVNILVDLFKTNADTETYCMLCRGLTVQLGNTYLFAACAEETQALVHYLVSDLKADSLTYRDDPDSSQSTADKDAISACTYGLLLCTMYYKSLLTRAQQDKLIVTFKDGLIATSSALATTRICLHALTVGMLELFAAMERNLFRILQQLAKIHSKDELSLHLVEFVSALSREPKLYANLRPVEFRMIFAVAVNYIRFHNDQRRRKATAATSSASETPRTVENYLPTSSLAKELARSHYVLILAYQVIDFYYLSLPPAIKAETANFLIAGLLQSNYDRSCLDELNEVCLDMIVLNLNQSNKGDNSQMDMHVSENLGPVVERSWIHHNGVVTIRAQAGGPLAQITVRNPSCTTSRVVDLPGELSRKYAERAESSAHSLPASPVTESPTSTLGPSTRGLSRGRSIGRSHRTHLHGAQGTVGAHPEANVLPLDSIAMLLRAELGPQNGMARGMQLPLRFSPAPCLAQEFITAYQGLQHIDPPKMLPVRSEVIARTIRNFDTTSPIDTYKICVMYVGPGQTTEREILLNQQGSPAYWDFLRRLGDIERLSGLKGFAAGLDTGGQDSDGRYTIRWQDLIAQLMFHVGTLIPAQEGKQEQIIRKKAHMANDYVQIVFNESGRDYVFDTIPSQCNYVQIIVTPVDGHISGREEHRPGMAYESAGASAQFMQLYKVKTQVNPDVPFAGPAMEPKILTLAALPAFVRSIGIHAAILSQVYTCYNIADPTLGKFVSPWRSRLWSIKRIRNSAQKEASARSPSTTMDGFGEIPESPAQLTTASQALGFLIRDLGEFYSTR